jgi:hypothetical protein
MGEGRYNPIILDLGTRWVAFPRERAPGTNWTGGWLGNRVKKSLALARNRTQAVQPVAIPTELSRVII